MDAETRTALYSLAIETSGRLGGVALAMGPDVLCAEQFSTDQRHAVELLPAIDSMCRAHDLSPGEIKHCYVSGGPGSFTGVRIGMTVARTLASIGDVRVVRMSTLDVIAHNALDLDSPPQSLAVILDAKRKKVFAAAFVLRADGYERTTAPVEVDPTEFFAHLPRPGVVIGEGTQFVTDAIAATDLTVPPERFHRARPEAVHHLGYASASRGHFDDVADLIPIYVRRPEAEEAWEKRHSARK